MLDANKPPLEDVYLSHFGTKGMRWGVRRKRPDEGERKRIFSKRNVTRAAAAATAIGGAIAVAYLFGGGRKSVSDIAVQKVLVSRQKTIELGKSPFTDLSKRFREAHVASLPSPHAMRLEAARAADRNLYDRIGAQKLTDRAWRDQARLSQLRREMDTTTNSLLTRNSQALSEESIRRAWADPNHVWEI